MVELTHEEECALDEFVSWANTIITRGEQETEATGNAIPALSAHLVVAHIETTCGLISDWLDPEDLVESRSFVETYAHLMDVVLARFASTGWLEIVPCGCGDCDNLAYVPAIPVCECCG